jgi:O-antigen/teichoic acid export membrane protein
MTSASLKRHVIASYLGQGWAAIMGIAFVPLYITVLGTESYGLIGIFAILQAGIALFDFGLTPTLNREMARARAGAHTATSIRDLLRSLEVIYCVLAIGIIIGVWLSAPWLATSWIKSHLLGQEVVVQSLKVMGFVLATRWMEQVYRGALQGLQDLVWWNTSNAVLATLRWAGAYLAVAFVSPTIFTFFLWQGAVSLLTVGVLVRRTYTILPKANQRARFSVTTLRNIRTFASGMFVGTLLSFILVQADKIIVSKLLSLEQLAYYTLASSVASGLLLLTVPMNTAVFPKLTDHVASHDEMILQDTYESSCQWLAAIIIPAALLLAFFAEPALVLWTGNVPLSKSVASLLSLLALGTLCNGLMNLPYMLLLAHGWTSLTIWVNIGAVLIVIPAMLFAVPRYGVTGAAWVWLILNASYLVVVIHLMHKKILISLKWRWYRVAIVQPLMAGGIVAALLRSLLPVPSNRFSAGIVVFVSALMLLVCVHAVLPSVRMSLWRIGLGIARAISDRVTAPRSP